MSQLNKTCLTSFPEYPHLHQVRVLQVLLEDRVISDSEFLKHLNVISFITFSSIHLSSSPNGLASIGLAKFYELPRTARMWDELN